MFVSVRYYRRAVIVVITVVCIAISTIVNIAIATVAVIVGGAMVVAVMIGVLP